METASRAPGTYAAVNGVNLYYETHGDGFPLVLLHGGLLNLETSFGALVPQFSKRHRIIAVDLQGHGRTADIDRKPTFEAMSDDVVALLRHLGVEQADFFGFSLGGLVSVSTVLRHPQFVRNLVLASVQMRPDGYHDDILEPEKYPDSTRMPTEVDFNAMQAEYKRVAPDPDHFFPFMQKITTTLGEFEGWSEDEIAGIASPTLIIVGDNDFVRVEHANEMYERLPDAKLAILPGTTHMAVMQRTSWVGSMVEEFFSAATPA